MVVNIHHFYKFGLETLHSPLVLEEWDFAYWQYNVNAFHLLVESFQFILTFMYCHCLFFQFKKNCQAGKYVSGQFFELSQAYIQSRGFSKIKTIEYSSFTVLLKHL